MRFTVIMVSRISMRRTTPQFETKVSKIENVQGTVRLHCTKILLYKENLHNPKIMQRLLRMLATAKDSQIEPAGVHPKATPRTSTQATRKATRETHENIICSACAYGTPSDGPQCRSDGQQSCLPE